MIGKLIGVDYGAARVGVAVSDALGIGAREHSIIQHTDDNSTFEALKKIARDENAVAFVVGVPYNVNAPDNIETQSDTVQAWIDKFREATTLPVIPWDEQLSSQEATDIAKRKGRVMRDPIDDIAARIILQRYLDALHDGLATPPQRP
jgi:putative Holliday junction resolvase